MDTDIVIRCGRCKQMKPPAAFSKSSSDKTGCQSWCKACASARNKERYDANPEELRAQVRKNREPARAAIRAAKDVPCHDCHQRYPFYVMDLDHRDAALKAFTIGRNKKPLAATLAEIAKCDVVCANCHRIRTWNRKNASSKENAVL